MAQTPGTAFERLVDVVARLRAPDGCPWDRAQTLETLRPFVLEETYEVLEAVDAGDRRSLGEEIGDLIFEGVLLAQLCAEAGDFTVTDSLVSITDKLVRRHPHVFGNAAKARTPDEVLGRWEDVKAQERAAAQTPEKPKTILSGVPKTLPALARAHEMSLRAAAVGFDWEHATDVLGKIEEEVAELREAVEGQASSPTRVEEEMGDLLFALANLARKLGIEPEAALRRADDKFSRRFTELELRFAARGESLREAGLERLEAEWGRVKADER